MAEKELKAIHLILRAAGMLSYKLPVVRKCRSVKTYSQFGHAPLDVTLTDQRLDVLAQLQVLIEGFKVVFG
ncbi:hypothetical protein D3C84_742940 [compost metagenome]